MYKLAAIQNEEGEFVPKIKISENTEKITNPGNKTIYRIYEKANGKIKADLICFADEVIDPKQDLLLTNLQERRVPLQISYIKGDRSILP